MLIYTSELLCVHASLCLVVQLALMGSTGGTLESWPSASATALHWVLGATLSAGTSSDDVGTSLWSQLQEACRPIMAQCYCTALASRGLNTSKCRDLMQEFSRCAFHSGDGIHTHGTPMGMYACQDIDCPRSPSTTCVYAGRQTPLLLCM